MLFRDGKKDVPSSIFQFQIIDWYKCDILSDNVVDKDGNADGEKSLVVKAFGTDSQGSSVSLNMTGFKPYFYIQLGKKKKITEYHKNELMNILNSSLPKKLKDLFELKTVAKKTLWGFTNNKKFQYIQIKFSCLTCMYFIKKFLSKYETQNKLQIGDIRTHISFHETNIDPLIRLLHERNIQPGGWVSVSNFTTTNVLESKCQIDIETDWTNVSPFENTTMAPFVVMSFDIECTSSHGDFPVAKKTYNKPANELIDFYEKKKYEFDYKTHIKNALHSMFDKTMTGYLSFVYTKNEIDSELIELQINTHLDDLINLIDNNIVYERGIRKADSYQQTVYQVEKKLNNIFPEIVGDEVIQIGSTLHRYGEKECFYKNVITLGTCDDIPGIDVIQCESEDEVIIEWCKLLNRLDPDIITGYNILGFDFNYLYERSLELGCDDNLLSCSRLQTHTSQFCEKSLSSSALGDNMLKYVEMEGRVIIDIMKVVQRDHKLDSYKLDNVVSSFINGKISEHNGNILRVDNTTGLNNNDYISINSIKYKIENITGKTISLDKPIVENEESVVKWGLAKDDVTPKDIFMCQKGTSADRAKIAKYCVQDCALCNSIVIKLEILANNIGMANVCYVPLSYIFLRGQGIKVFSLVAKHCNDDNFVIPSITFDPNNPDPEGYEGAIVLDPKPGIYIDAPISVMDYASLYPSSMISENISHDSIVLDSNYDNLEGYSYVDITYDIYCGTGDDKVKTGEKVCRYAQFPNNEKGVLPRILMTLLSQRKKTRKKIEHKVITLDDVSYTGMIVKDSETEYELMTESNELVKINKTHAKVADKYDEFSKAVLDGLQLAYKVTANSLYGSVGAKTSSIYMKELAASTTATGRNLILKAKEFMEINYDAKVIYGDTDSIFVDFKIKDKYGITDQKEILQKSIDVSVDASSNFKKTLKSPHDLEYEKTFYPFIILSKKKYVGNLYEFNVNKFKQKSMGIVLKRRDNANIVKQVYGGLIDILLKGESINNAVKFLHNSLQRLIRGEYPMNELVISKTLRSKYANPTRIAHKVLADRMRERDPGSAPEINERVPYVYIEHDAKNKSLLQGDKIEHPSYITDNKLKINYEFYITNQLSNPISQLLALNIHELPKSKSETYYKNKYSKLLSTMSEKKASDKINDIKQKDVHELLFSPVLTELHNRRMGHQSLTTFFKPI
jgi:DNA polymerase elongation subunit (family B)